MTCLSMNVADCMSEDPLKPERLLNPAVKEFCL